MYVFFGLIASGKSTLALAWARRLGLACFNSDVLRKELAGQTSDGADLQFEAGIYSPEFTEKTYMTLIDKTAGEVGSGRSVVLDASFRSRSERERIRCLAKKHGACARFILCSCPENTLRTRMEKRKLDPEAVSDGRWEIYLRQKEIFARPDELAVEECITIMTDAPVDELLDLLAQHFDTLIKK